MAEKEIKDVQPEEKTKEEKKNPGIKKNVIIIVTALIAALAVCALAIGIIEANKNGDGERKTYPPVDESLLSDTKPEGFDIMEYDEYIDKHDINIYYKNGGIKESVTEDKAGNYGEAFSVVYNVLLTIRDGNAALYNLYMGNSKLEKKDFTQQQIYDITITFQPGYTDDEKVSFDRSVFKVEYKIHENNGTYRNNIESDSSRPIYFIVDNSSGEMLVTDMIEP